MSSPWSFFILTVIARHAFNSLPIHFMDENFKWWSIRLESHLLKERLHPVSSPLVSSLVFSFSREWDDRRRHYQMLPFPLANVIHDSQFSSLSFMWWFVGIVPPFLPRLSCFLEHVSHPKGHYCVYDYHYSLSFPSPPFSWCAWLPRFSFLFALLLYCNWKACSSKR